MKQIFINVKQTTKALRLLMQKAQKYEDGNYNAKSAKRLKKQTHMTSEHPLNFSFPFRFHRKGETKEGWYLRGSQSMENTFLPKYS